MEGEIVNRVAGSSLISIDLDEYLNKGDRLVFDLKETLFQGLILREKDFRLFVKEHDWNRYKSKNVALLCSTDAIIPAWAFMLVVSKLRPLVNEVVVGDVDDLEKVLIDQAIKNITSEGLDGKKVVVKGCGDTKNRDYAYGQIAKELTPIVSSLMYGEPCSTVPVYKKAKEKKL